MSIYDTLNKEQKEAVFCTEGPLLILAGAGSGKTRVLTHRIAYLIDECQVNPWNILAITFTNKAAGEMRERVDQIVDFGAEDIWVSTFHSTCVRILRRYIDRLGYDRSFTIYDGDDQKTVIKEVCKKLNIDTKIYKERTLLSAISSAKDEMIGPKEYLLRSEGDYARQRIAQVYEEYQKRLRSNNALDFDDLLFKTVELFKTDAEVLNYYQEIGTSRRWNCFGIIPMCWIIIRNVLSTLWWMSIRIRTRFSSSLSVCWRQSTGISVWSVMMISRFTSSEVRISTTFLILKKHFRMQR